MAGSGAVPIAYPTSPTGSIHARRLRDLLRLAISDGTYSDRSGRLPSEAELMAEYGASRTAVRSALALLCDEGLVTRHRGLGTTRVAVYDVVDLAIPAGSAHPSIRNAKGVIPLVLHRAWMPAPTVIASRLTGVAEGDPCLAIEYLLTFGGQAVAVITNYIRGEEAELVDSLAFSTDFYSFLGSGGIVLSDQGATLQPRLADQHVASLLCIEPGSPVLAFEQVIRDDRREVIDVALGTFRGDIRITVAGPS